MSLVINTNEQATRIHGVYNRNNTMMNAAMTKVATAQKINSARDGAANWAISEKMRERIRANDQANQNVQNDTALLKTAQGGIDNTIDILKTLKERAINAANDSNINTDRSAIATEVYQLVSQIDDNAAKVKFNGRTLLDGSLGVSDSGNGATITSPKGDKAVYEFTGLKKLNSGIAVSATVDDKLVDLVDSNGKNIFQEGDKITLSWKENGESKSSTLTVSNSNKMLTLTGLTINTTSTAKNAAGTTAWSTAVNDGGYITGAAETFISDVSLSVTRTKADGTTVHNTAAENAIGIKGVQQSYGPKEGSNTVYAYTNTNFAGTGLSQKIGDVVIDSSKYLNTNGSQDYGALLKIKVGDTSVELNGNQTLNDLNAAFISKGINYRVAVASADGAEIEGVTRGSGALASTFIAEKKGLYFIATNGETRQLTISSPSISTTEVLKKVATTSSDANSALSPSYDNGNGLTFHIGGEANFYMDMGIRAMTTANLLGSSASGFADMFTSKENARNAISVIDNALQSALNEQTKLGAMESRLGYTSDNLVTMNENLEAANSAIRDADIAREMTNYMKFAVLSQSSQYMLAQAGQNAYQVLNLLNA